MHREMTPVGDDIVSSIPQGYWSGTLRPLGERKLSSGGLSAGLDRSSDLVF